MKWATLLALGIVVAAVSVGASVGSAADGEASARYVFSFKHGLQGARIGAPASAYHARLRSAVRLPNLGKDVCFGLAYAVSSAARAARRADLELYCGDKQQITEVHLGSSAFCSTAGTCIGTAGSLRRFAAELKASASVQHDMECPSGGTGCTTLEASFGRVQVSVRSGNCRRFTSIAAIGAGCAAADVLIYRFD